MKENQKEVKMGEKLTAKEIKEVEDKVDKEIEKEVKEIVSNLDS